MRWYLTMFILILIISMISCTSDSNTSKQITQQPKVNNVTFEKIRITKDFNYQIPEELYLTKNNLIFFKQIDYDLGIEKKGFM